MPIATARLCHSAAPAAQLVVIFPVVRSASNNMEQTLRLPVWLLRQGREGGREQERRGEREGGRKEGRKGGREGEGDR